MIKEFKNIEEIKTEIKNNLEIKKLTVDQLRKIMHIKGEIMQASFINALNELELEGKIYLDEKGYYKNFDTKSLGKVQGKIHINKTGQGFVVVEKDDKKTKYLINEEHLNGALDGDIVVLNNIHQGKINYVDATVEKIIKRAKGKTIFEYVGDGGFIPYSMHGNIRVICPKEELKRIVVGNRVLINIGKEMIAKIDNNLVFEGNIDQVIGHKDDPDIEVATIAADHGFFKEFPEEVIEQLKTIPNKVLPEELDNRIDLRNKKIFTIDGKDTKDMDDAISIDKDENGNYLLSVHIADVSHYVKEGTPLYEEAQKRGTSAYLADSVIPMLPHQLSNGICSLNENEDRLTKTVDIIISPNGEILDYFIYDSVINSKKKMNYDDVNKILEENIIPKGYEPFIIDLLLMRELALLLNEKRKNAGKVDFYSDEIKAIVDPTGNPVEFEARNQNTAERIIENFMIAANHCVAEYHDYLGIPFVFRIHGDPNDDNLIEALKQLKQEKLCTKNEVDSLINKIKNGHYNSKDLNEFLEKCKSKENYPIISKLILKSMSKAKYSSTNEGHYGLGLKDYTHFTSPIRRFPDLQVHHLINHYYTYENIPQILSYEYTLPEMCEHSSFMEREADKAEKETLDLKMAQYMQRLFENDSNRIYSGRIIQMTPYDTEIKLDNNVIGHVTPSDLAHAKAVRHNQKLKLGEKVFVLIKEVSIPNRIIYFNLNYKELSKSKQMVKK